MLSGILKINCGMVKKNNYLYRVFVSSVVFTSLWFVAIGAASDGTSHVTQTYDRSVALSQSKRISIDTPRVSGSINTVGARLDDLLLKDYRETVDPTSPEIELLAPSGVKKGYFAELGFSGNDAIGTVPGPATEWNIEGNDKLTPSTPVTLTYANEKGIQFKRVISIDENYMFSVEDTITNPTDVAVSLSSYGRVTRFEKPEHVDSIYSLQHEGLIGVIGDYDLHEASYSKIEDTKSILLPKGTGGWLGIADKFWAAILIPSQNEAFESRFSFFSDGRKRYQVDFLGEPMIIAAGQGAVVRKHIFVGAKEVAQIAGYERKIGIRRFQILTYRSGGLPPEK